ILFIMRSSCCWSVGRDSTEVAIDVPTGGCDLRNGNKPIASVTQEHGAGCAVACVAFVLGTSYQEALALFKRPNHAWGRGFYCREIIEALETAGKKYSFVHFNASVKKRVEMPET